MKEAEQYAAEDKKNKEAVEVKNQADSLIYQTEKTMGEMADKLDPADKSMLESELAEFKKVREGDNPEAIKSAMEAFSKIYQQQAQQAQPQDGQGGANVNDDGTVESSFTDDNP